MLVCFYDLNGGQKASYRRCKVAPLLISLAQRSFLCPPSPCPVLAKRKRRVSRLNWLQVHQQGPRANLLDAPARAIVLQRLTHRFLFYNSEPTCLPARARLPPVSNRLPCFSLTEPHKYLKTSLCVLARSRESPITGLGSVPDSSRAVSAAACPGKAWVGEHCWRGASWVLQWPATVQKWAVFSGRAPCPGVGGVPAPHSNHARLLLGPTNLYRCLLDHAMFDSGASRPESQEHLCACEQTAGSTELAASTLCVNR